MKLLADLPLIGLAAKAQSGKTTVANRICLVHGYIHESFAEPIRKFIADLTGISRTDLEDAAIKEAVIPWIGRSPRYMMQTLGTEWGRDCVLKDFWVKRCLQAVERNTINAQRPTVISDVRFDNEAQAIRDLGGIVIHLVRPNALVVAAHASEAGVGFNGPAGDRRIVNDGTLDDLYAQVDSLIESL